MAAKKKTVAIKDAGVILHLQGVLQAVLKEPKNFETKLTEGELNRIEDCRKEIDNTVVIAGWATENRNLYLKLVDLGKDIPPATQKITSETEDTMWRRNRNRFAA